MHFLIAFKVLSVGQSVVHAQIVFIRSFYKRVLKKNTVRKFIILHYKVAKRTFAKDRQSRQTCGDMHA